MALAYDLALMLPRRVGHAGWQLGKKTARNATALPLSEGGRQDAWMLPCNAARRVQCAVSVEESSSTAGSVETEVSVGLAFSSSQSIGSGLLTSARASTSS